MKLRRTESSGSTAISSTPASSDRRPSLGSGSGASDHRCAGIDWSRREGSRVGVEDGWSQPWHGAGGNLFNADPELMPDLVQVAWADTPLGPPDTWPQSLQTAVSILLSSRFSMWMAWGPELTFFCNAAYRRDTLGHKYPWALGRPAREVWAEIWDDIGPRID